MFGIDKIDVIALVLLASLFLQAYGFYKLYLVANK